MPIKDPQAHASNALLAATRCAARVAERVRRTRQRDAISAQLIAKSRIMVQESNTLLARAAINSLYAPEGEKK